jgi:hypothetical protein
MIMIRLDEYGGFDDFEAGNSSSRITQDILFGTLLTTLVPPQAELGRTNLKDFRLAWKSYVIASI